ncbi:hypothetical protein MKW94_027479 [Papaver nudicaule]|uniref:EF-hand domain-containing protein n=1 Tax=Papaver nudicaule TaxID=74823 RepID=A0AA41SHY5_PAPNU|nr:hypothetical protein [Papaver nudicaule]
MKQESSESMSSPAESPPPPQQTPSVFMSSNKKFQEFEEIFKEFDLGLIMSSLGHTAYEEELKNMVKEVDTDGDGFIDLDEFIELNTTDPEKLLKIIGIYS